MSLHEHLLHDPTLWLVGSFAAFMVLAFVFGRKSVAGMLDSKIDKIRANIAAAETLKSEAEMLIAQYKSNLANAHTEAATILANAQKQAADMRAKAEKDLQESAARREAMLGNRIEQMERAAIDDIRRYAAELAVSATAEIIAQKMTPQAVDALTSQSIKHISEKLN